MTMWCQLLPTFHSRQAFELGLILTAKATLGVCCWYISPGSVPEAFSHRVREAWIWMVTVGLCHKDYQNKKFLCSMKQCHACVGRGHHTSQPASSFALTPHPHIVSAHITGVNVLNMQQHNWPWQCAICHIFDRSLWGNVTCGGHPNLPTEVFVA